MKVDKTNPYHWILIALSLGNVFVALLLRRLATKQRRRVVLYGHRLGGNLLAIHRKLCSQPEGFEVRFLTMDPAYHRQLAEIGVPALLAPSPRSIGWLATTDAMVTDHGLHALEPLLHMSDMKFFDVWHGIPFKGFDADDFRVQHRYDEVWVPSPMVARLYVERFGFEEGRVVATGYARTDRLVTEKDCGRGGLRRSLGLPEQGKIVLFAPTWQQDDEGRSVFPFGAEPEEFLGMLSKLAVRTGSTVILRAHLNSGLEVLRGGFDGIVAMPYAENPDTEAILLASDVLVCDWSSIAFDWLLLDRPAVFLDVPPPFRKGLSLGPEFRFGPLVGSAECLVEILARLLGDAVDRDDGFVAERGRISALVYGDCADGHATERCLSRLGSALASNGG